MVSIANVETGGPDDDEGDAMLPVTWHVKGSFDLITAERQKE